MTITYTIPGVPLINQLKEPTSDGRPDENARDNCVFASNAAMATAYLHKPFNGDQLKDMDNNYGQGYVGFASEANLLDTMARLGIKVARVKHDTQQELVDELHWQIEHYHHACIVTMPSRWNSAVEDAGKDWNPRTYRGYSHVGLACGTGPGMIRVMNPWGGFWHDGSDSYWSARLLEGEIWVGTLIEGVSQMAVPSGWKDDGKTLVAPNGIPVVHGFRDYVLAHAWATNNWPLAPEQVTTSGSIEPGNASIGPGSRQDFRLTSLGWTQSRNVYVIYVGQDVQALSHQLAAANQHVSQLEAQIAQMQQQQQTPPDPKATESLAALVELAKALKLVETVAAA